MWMAKGGDIRQMHGKLKKACANTILILAIEQCPGTRVVSS